MIENSVQLIHRVLDGEEEAFTELVQKYQKKIHALTWRKIGDYHIAEEITQDIFFQVYKNLPMLKNPILFEGWLYVVTNRLCLNWIKKNKVEKGHLTIQLLEDTPPKELVDSFYTQHQIEQREKEKIEHYQNIVKELLEILPESERTVITLYYLGDMTAQEIGKFLGVSVNTIKSRLHRARNRLKTEEELLLNENLGSLQLSTDMTENILRQIADIKPKPQVIKPIFPWAAFGSAIVLVLLLLGSMNRFFPHFQIPYDFGALSEPTIDIVESPISIDIISKLAVENRNIRHVTDSDNEGIGSTDSEATFPTNVLENALSTYIGEWTQANGPQGSPYHNLFATTDNKIYAVSETSLYRLSQNGTTWMQINDNLPFNLFFSPRTDHRGVIYAVDTNEIYASTDNGETWRTFCEKPKGEVMKLIITDITQDDFFMYLAYKQQGIFRSSDAGRNWMPFNNGLTAKKIYAAAKIDSTVFIGTNKGLYRSKSNGWDLLPIDPLKSVHSIATLENNLYVVTGADFRSPDYSKMVKRSKTPHRIYHSTDSGSSWTEITPTYQASEPVPIYMGSTKINAVNKLLWVLGLPSFRSMDGGKTWTNMGLDLNLLPSLYSSVQALNEHTFFKVAETGIIRTTDGGDTWHPFTQETVNTRVQDVVAFNDRLYVYTGTKFYRSVDDGNTWKEIPINYTIFKPRLTTNDGQPIYHFTEAKLIMADNQLYGIVPRGKELRVFRLSKNDGSLWMIGKIASPKQWQSGKTTDQSNVAYVPKFGGFAISGETLFIEFRWKLYKWSPGATDVIDTGLTDTGRHAVDALGLDRGFKIAVSDEVVYVGKRDGRLHQSIDAGESWRDITATMPSSFSHIKDIAFVESTVFVATDNGVLTSETGNHWRLLTDDNGNAIVMDRFTQYGSRFYGAGDLGIYSLNSEKQWKLISANIPGKVISLSSGQNKLYIGTEKRGIFHTMLE